MAYSRLMMLLERLDNMKDETQIVALSALQSVPSLSHLSLIGFPNTTTGLEESIVFVQQVLTALSALQNSSTGMQYKKLASALPALVASGLEQRMLTPLVGYIDAASTCEFDEEDDPIEEVIDLSHTTDRSIHINTEFHSPSLSPLDATFRGVFVSRNRSVVYGDPATKVAIHGAGFVLSTTVPRRDLLQLPPGVSELAIFAPQFHSFSGVETANPWLAGAVEIAVTNGATISVSNPSVFIVDAPEGGFISFGSATTAFVVIKCLAHDDGSKRFAGTAVSLVKAVENGLDIAVGLHAKFEMDVMRLAEAVIAALNAHFSDGLNSFNRSHLASFSKLGIWAYGPRDNVGYLNGLLSVRATRLAMFSVVYKTLDYERT